MASSRYWWYEPGSGVRSQVHPISQIWGVEMTLFGGSIPHTNPVLYALNTPILVVVARGIWSHGSGDPPF